MKWVGEIFSNESENSSRRRNNHKWWERKIFFYETALENDKITFINFSISLGIATKTNKYGDFELEKLETGGPYSIKIERSGNRQNKIKLVDTGKDMFLEENLLSP
jgi:hypothetical protein